MSSLFGYIDKCDVVRHVYEDLKRSRMLRERIQDFGIVQPEKQLNEGWTNLVRHLMNAKDEHFFIAGYYRVIKTEQVVAYRSYVNDSLRLNDVPSIYGTNPAIPRWASGFQVAIDRLNRDVRVFESHNDDEDNEVK